LNNLPTLHALDKRPTQCLVNIPLPAPYTQAVGRFHKINASDVTALVDWFPYNAFRVTLFHHSAIHEAAVIGSETPEEGQQLQKNNPFPY
jgi:hypothetical protein